MDLRTALRTEIALRRRLDELVPFGAAGQAILLDLALCRIEGRGVTVTDAMLAAYGTYRTTAYAYMKRLLEAGLIRREKDSTDGKRIWVHITDEGFARVSAVFEPAAMVRAA